MFQVLINVTRFTVRLDDSGDHRIDGVTFTTGEPKPARTMGVERAEAGVSTYAERQSWSFRIRVPRVRVGERAPDTLQWIPLHRVGSVGRSDKLRLAGIAEFGLGKQSPPSK